jgi:hypothetical protein
MFTHRTADRLAALRAFSKGVGAIDAVVGHALRRAIDWHPDGGALTAIALASMGANISRSEIGVFIERANDYSRDRRRDPDYYWNDEFRWREDLEQEIEWHNHDILVASIGRSGVRIELRVGEGRAVVAVRVEYDSPEARDLAVECARRTEANFSPRLELLAEDL